MASVSGGQKLAAPYGFDRFSHNYSVHFHVRARGKILYREFVFGRNIGFQRVGLRLQQNLLAFAEIGEGNYDVVTRVEFENLIGHEKESSLCLHCKRLGQNRPGEL